MTDLEDIENTLAGGWTTVGYLNAILVTLIEIAIALKVDETKLMENVNEAGNNP